MDLIQPAEISGKIMTLIDQAKKQIIIISPYNKFNYWKKLTQRIEKAKERGVEFKWYIRKNVDNNAEPIRKLGINPIEIENLHCKLYMNEQHAIVTSMNLHEYSDSSSIDIGYYITDSNMYNELLDFISIYIDSCALKDINVEKKENNTKKELSKNIVDNTEFDFREILIDYLQEYKTKRSLNFNFDKGFVSKLKLENFIENYDLFFEPKSSYFRVDLRINYPYKLQSKIYESLKSKGELLSELCGEPIEFGNQMKRLKIDLKVLDNNNYKDWSINQFETLKPRLNRILDTYLNELKN